MGDTRHNPSINLRVPPDLIRQIEQIARKKGYRTRQEVILEFVRDGLDRAKAGVPA